MRVPVIRKNIIFTPDSKRVVTRYFMNGDERTQNMVSRIMILEDKEVLETLAQTLREFARRHRNISQEFLKHCEKIRGIIEGMKIDYENISQERKMLIGSYCTMEYSLESAAFFNPSIVEDFDQSDLEEGEKRVIISFRATGEGHISSIVFRRGILDQNNDLRVMKIGKNIDKAEVYSIDGKLISTESNVKMLNFSKNQKGIYLVKIYTKSGVQTQKIIK